MPPTNLEATAIILDIGPLVTEASESGQSFFEQSIACASRIIERKIFSRPTDLLEIVLLGSEESVNNLAVQQGGYQHISIATELNVPSWKLIKTLNNKIKPTEKCADWIEALVVAADSLHTELSTRKTKVSSKKVILMTDFKSKTDFGDEEIQQIIDSYKAKDIELIILGSEIWADDDDDEDGYQKIPLTSQQEINSKILKTLIMELDCIACTFQDANAQLLFHKKKAVNPHPTHVDLSIGPDIRIPITWFGRIRQAASQAKWKSSYNPVKSGSDPNNDDDFKFKTETSVPGAIESVKTYYKKEDNMDIVNFEDVITGYRYGGAIVPFTKIDKSMEYESGDRGLTVYAFTKQDNIHWSDLIDDGITYVFSRKEHDNAKLAIDSLVTALKKLGFVIIARKVTYKNCAPRMVVLFPIVKKTYKCLSMVGLAYKEDHRQMIFSNLNRKKLLPSDEQLKAIDNLIKTMDLSRIGEDGKELFSIEATINPVVQHIYDCLAHRALNPEGALPSPRPDIQRLLEIPSSVATLASEPLQEIKTLFPLKVIEKIKGGKRWIDKNLAADDKRANVEDLPDIKDTKVATVLKSNITNVGSVNPIEDFKELLETGMSFVTVFQQLTEVIEELVIKSFGDDYVKPLSATKVIRDECFVKYPTIYNEWLIKLKCTLLEKMKFNYFKRIVENNLGLITMAMNATSTISESFARSFESLEVVESISKPAGIDVSEIDDLFD